MVKGISRNVLGHTRLQYGTEFILSLTVSLVWLEYYKFSRHFGDSAPLVELVFVYFNSSQENLLINHLECQFYLVPPELMP